MSERPFTEALEERDITLALTTTQLVVLALGTVILLRFIRALRQA
jgi:hypothetical protein